MREVGPQQDQVTALVGLDAVADKSLARTGFDERQLALGVLMPGEVEGV